MCQCLGSDGGGVSFIYSGIWGFSAKNTTRRAPVIFTSAGIHTLPLQQEKVANGQAVTCRLDLGDSVNVAGTIPNLQ